MTSFRYDPARQGGGRCCGFLRRVAAAGAAFSVPSILTKPLSGDSAPNNRVHVAQIGSSSFGSGYRRVECQEMQTAGDT